MGSIPIHELFEADDTSCKVLPLNAPSDYSSNEAHRHNYYELLFFVKGKGTHMIDFDNHAIGSRSIHFVSAGQVHALHRDKSTKGYVIAFSKEFVYLNSSDKSILNDFPAFNKTAAPVLKLDASAVAEMESLVNTMAAEHTGTNPFREKILGSYISILLLKCRALLVSGSGKAIDSSAQQLLLGFNDLLDEHFIRLHKVSDYADLLRVSPNHLSETIKKSSGKTAGDLIRDRLVLEAKRLLLHSAATAKEIAYHLNFNDPSYFSRFLKTNTGLSPEEFRKQIREKYQH